jgi:hypothetical protein
MAKQISATRRSPENTLTVTIQRSLVTAYLLLGDISQAENATLEAIEFWKPESGEQALFLGVLDAALRRLRLSLRSEPIDAPGAEFWLPVELRSVLRLPRALRICYVLRVLVGLPAEVCHQIPGIEPGCVDRQAVVAILALSDLEKVPEEKKGQTRPMHQLNDNEVRQLAYRLWQERGCPPDTPHGDWFRAEDELRRTGPTTELALFPLAMGPAEE